MNLDSMLLWQFRSYEKQLFTFSKTITLIVGPNATGKTNILEAIYLLATGKSFRAEKESDVIFWNKECSRIKATVQNPSSKDVKVDRTQLELVSTHGIVQGQKVPSKKYLVNGVSRRLIDFIGNIRAVYFSPEDLKLITDSPSVRRNYLNSILSQVDREYRRNLMSYERGLRQRNMLLDRIFQGAATRSQLLFWDQLLIRTGSYITDAREQFIQKANGYHIADLHYFIRYDPSIISESRLMQYKDEEVAAKNTLVGPQRDDFVVVKEKTAHTAVQKDGIEMSRFGSRGEQRLSVLWLKFAELQYIEQQSGQRPILLLDDIFSELDQESRDSVLSNINSQQTIITSAEENVCSLFKKTKDVQIIRLPLG